MSCTVNSKVVRYTDPPAPEPKAQLVYTDSDYLNGRKITITNDPQRSKLLIARVEMSPNWPGAERCYDFEVKVDGRVYQGTGFRLERSGSLHADNYEIQLPDAGRTKITGRLGHAHNNSGIPPHSY